MELDIGAAIFFVLSLASATGERRIFTSCRMAIAGPLDVKARNA
jgi:hypothetical protein